MNERVRFWFILAGVAACIAVMVFLFGYKSGPAPAPDPDAASASPPPAAAPIPPAAPSDGAPQQPATVAGAAARPAAAAARPASAAVAQGVIAGWVVYADGEPAPGAEVTLRWTPENGAPGDTAVPERSVRTDDQGYFLFDRAPDGDYALRATDGSLTATGRTVLRIRRRAETVLFLEHAGVIAGRVIDESGAPIAGAEVTAAPAPPDFPIPRTNGALSAVTGEDGAFFVEGLADEAHILLAKAEGYAAAASRPARPGAEVELILGAGGSAAGRTVDSASNEPVGGVRIALYDADVIGHGVETVSGPDGSFRFDALRAAPYAVRVNDSAYILAGSVGDIAVVTGETSELDIPVQTAGGFRGVVVDAQSREPVAGAVVDMILSGGARHYGHRRSYRSAPTGADGVFTVSGLPDGEYDVIASPAGDYTMIRPVLLRLERGQQVGGAVVEMQKGLILRGRVLTASGEPAEGAAVTISGGILDVFHAVSDENGAFEIGALPPFGRLMIAAALGPLRSPDVGPIAFSRGGVAEVDLRLDAEPSREIVSRFLETRTRTQPPAPQGDESIAGVVVDAAGEPVEGASVRSQGVTARSGADGAFVLAGLTPGEHRLGASHGEYGPVSLMAKAGDLDVRIEMAAPVVHGRVVDAESGAPITRFEAGEVMIPGGGVNAAGPMRLIEDPEGRFTVRVRGQMGDSVTVAVRAEGYAPRVAGGSRNAEITVALQRGRTVSGRVVDKSGTGVTDAYVFVGGVPAHPTAMMAYDAVSGPDGAFTLQNVPDDARGLSALRFGYSEGYTPFAGRDENLTIALGDGATLEVRVDTANWPGRPNVSIGRRDSNFGIGGKPFDADGVSITEGLPAGPSFVDVSMLDDESRSTGMSRFHWSQRYDVELSDQQPVLIEAAFPPLSAAAEGTVTRDGQPVSHVTVYLFYREADGVNGSFRTRTDAAGFYRFDPVPAGTARVEVEGQGNGARAEAILTDGAGTRADIDLTPPEEEPAP